MPVQLRLGMMPGSIPTAAVNAVLAWLNVRPGTSARRAPIPGPATCMFYLQQGNDPDKLRAIALKITLDPIR